MKRLIIFFFVLSYFFALAQDTLFLKGDYYLGKFRLPYRLLLPKDYKPKINKKYPLILFLHGAGERGTDNEKQLTHIAPVVEQDSFREAYEAFVLAPQCPEGRKWVEVDWSSLSHKIPAEPSLPMKATIKLLDSIIKAYPIDTNRIYVIGLSMGGYGVWDIIARYPNKFAAAVPICGGADLSTAPKIAHLPIWVFHGAKDKVVPVQRSRSMVKELKKYGGSPKYTEYPNVYHGAWYPAFKNKELFRWLFSQNKQNQLRIRKLTYQKNN